MDLTLSRGFFIRLILLVALATVCGCVDRKRGEWVFPTALPATDVASDSTPDVVDRSPRPDDSTQLSTVPGEPAFVKPVVATLPAARNAIKPKGPLPSLQLADWQQNHSLHWRTTLGEGGAELPLVARSTREIPREHRISRLLGVYFPPGEKEAVFVGAFDPLRPALDPDDLLDALVVAYRTWWQGEQRGVSIDPPQRSSFSGDQQVRFIGGIGNTDVGFVAFEADRLMKCLSLGGDNKSGLPFTCSVAGFQNKFALSRKFPSSNASRHRFWFEAQNPLAAVSTDQRLVVAQSLLRVEARNETSGEDAPADQASEAFARHLTDHFDAYAVDPGLTVFSRLHAHAVLFAIAGKLHGEVVQKNGNSKTSTIHRNPYLPGWLAAGHHVRKVSTPLTTKTLTREERHANNDGSTIIQQMVGGVRLDTDHPQPWNDSPVQVLSSELQLQMQSAPEARYWRWTARGQNYGAVRLGRIAEFKAWHRDLAKSDLQLEREWNSAADWNSEFGANWKLRLPRLRFSHDTTLLSSTERRPAYALVENGLGETVYLSEFGSRGIVGGPEVSTFTSRDGKRGLLFSKNGFLFYEGNVQLQDNNGLTVVAQPGARVVNFLRVPGDEGHALSAAAKYRVENVAETANTPAIEYRYDQKSRLTAISTAPQQTVDLKYDDRGRIMRAEFADHSDARNYRYNHRGQLMRVSDDRGEHLGYHYDPDNGQLTTLGARFSETPPVVGQMSFEEQGSARSEVRPASDSVQHWHVTADDQRKFKVAVNNVERESATLPLRLEDLEGASPADLKSSFQAALQEWLTNQTQVVLVSGDLVERQQLAGLVSIVQPDKVVVATHNLQAASQRVGGGTAIFNNRVQLFFAEELVADAALKDGVRELRQSLLSAAERLNDRTASVVILPGHRDGRYLELLKQLYESGTLANKCVLLLTCKSEEPISDAGIVEAMLDDNQLRAATISRSPRLIDQQQLPQIIQKIEESLQKLGSETSSSEILRAINQAVQGLGRVELHHQAQTSPRNQRLLRIKLSRLAGATSGWAC